MEVKKKLKDWQIGLSWGIAFGMTALCVCLILHYMKTGIILLACFSTAGTILYKPVMKWIRKRRE